MRSEHVTRAVLALAGAVALSSCGVLEPPTPPARTVGGIPGAGSGGAPVPQGGGDPGGQTDPRVGNPPLPGYQLAWHDEFDGSALDPKSWNVDTGPWRDAVNAADAIEVSGGSLSLVTFTDAAGVTHAGHVNTQGKFAGRYGYYEARVRLHGAPGEWCSFFVYPKTIGQPVGDPGAAGVEADVFEHRVVDGDGWPIQDMIQVGINWDGFGRYWKRSNAMVAQPDGAPLQDAWHVYSVLWTAAGYDYYIDGLPVFQTSKAVSNIAEPVYLTCEISDGSWAGHVPAGGYGPRATSTTRMQVDWVRVWEPVDPAAR